MAKITAKKIIDTLAESPLKWKITKLGQIRATTKTRGEYMCPVTAYAKLEYGERVSCPDAPFWSEDTGRDFLYDACALVIDAADNSPKEIKFADSLSFSPKKTLQFRQYMLKSFGLEEK